MVSHGRSVIFTHVPKTAGKAIRHLFGLPEFERDYVPGVESFEHAFGHKSLMELRDEPYFPKYFKFAFVRNPFDRLVSSFFYLNSGGCNAVDSSFRDQHLAEYGGNFRAFVEDLDRLIAKVHFKPQVAWLRDDCGALLTDFVGRYERVETDLSIIADRLGVRPADLPLMNASLHAPYATYYDIATQRRVERLYGEDLERFEYGFRHG